MLDWLEKVIINVDKNSENPLEDILNAILCLDDKNFERVTKTVDFSEDLGLKFYYGDEEIEIPISVIFNYLDKSAKNFEENSEQHKRIKTILESRNEEKFCSVALEKIKGIESYEFLMVKKIFEMLGNDELFLKFKNFDMNKELFKVNAKGFEKSQDVNNYLRIMVSIFGSIDQDGELVNTSEVLDDFYIPNIEEYKSKYIELYEIYESLIKKQVNKSNYRFEIRKIDDNASIVEAEPEWKLNDNIKKMILDGMPEELSPEEKAIYVYTKMCKIFAYDEGYVYRSKDKGNKINYTSEFSKEHLEGLTSDSAITCYDFARIYQKVINELDDKIDAVILAQGLNQGHFYIGFSTENCQATLEAINITNVDGMKANDLARAKGNIRLDGIKFVSGEQKTLSQAIDKVNSLLLGRQEFTTADYVKELMETPIADEQEESSIEHMDLLKSLINNMKKLKIFGNEFVMFFNDVVHRFGIMKENIEYSFIGEVTKQGENSNNYRRKIWLREKRKDECETDIMYLLDTGSLELCEVTEIEMRDRFTRGEVIYENENRQMNGFKLEGK